MPGTRRRFTSEKAEAAEQVRLQLENKRLEQEKENLKRVIASFHPERIPTLRYRFVAAERSHFPVQMLCSHRDVIRPAGEESRPDPLEGRS